MEVFNPILIGATLALAAGAIGVMSVLPARMRAEFVYAQLCIMAGIYVGFAIVGLDGKDFITRSDWSAVIVETVLMLVFIFAGLAALNSERVWLLGVLILAHGATDFLHIVIGEGTAPAWYAFGCVLYDAAVGAAAVIMLPAGAAPKH